MLASLDKPCLVIVDLKLRGANELGFIQKMKEEPALADHPVVVASARALTLTGVAKTYPKPSLFGDIIAVVRELCGEPPRWRRLTPPDEEK
jgi:hypothetical protein